MTSTCSDDDIARQVDLLLGSLRPEIHMDAKALGRAYRDVLRTVPPMPLEEAVFMLRFNKAPADYSRTFAPMPPKLLALVESRVAHWRLRADHLRMLLTLPEAVRVVEITDDERRANQARIAALRQRALTKGEEA